VPMRFRIAFAWPVLFLPETPPTCCDAARIGPGAGGISMIGRAFGIHGVEMEDDASVAREEARVRHEFWPKFRRFAARLPFAEDLVTAYFCAFDRDTPRRVQVALIGALAYFVLPFDFVPDMLPFIGFTDDAAVLATAIRLVSVHIRPQHREAARRVLARAAAAPPGHPPHAGKGRVGDEPGLEEQEVGAASV
jgi:uncharacterized membrane protein YkvA (DUF1232 family)